MSVNSTLYWLRNERDRVIVRSNFEQYVFADRAAAALRAGFRLELVTIDDLAFVISGDSPEVWLKGRPLDPKSEYFHTKLLTWPQHAADQGRLLYAVQVLAESGFGCTTSVMTNLYNNHKFLTFLQPAMHGVDVLDTIQVFTRQFGFWFDAYPLDKIDFPVVVKPANWSSGFGVNKVSDLSELRQVLTLFSAAELDALIQRFVDYSQDYRIYCIDGVPMLATLRQSIYSTTKQSPNASVIVDVPAELKAIAEPIASRLGLPFVCLDLIVSDDAVYLSEMEVDGGVPYLLMNVDDRAMVLETERFAAYRRHFSAMGKLA
ncbi:ATP-grasp domain-containing protein [Nesterenkonia alkaliphila]|uniref:ATP-grasp domain-containing protein n=1 Tax=Nesterenkonia alkaliphila TaxID=1463631 RepID=A0A7K1UGY9_9MICC|nr:hypothetical protein [Nesterenkonia alkaliphila]MVT25740.1 hypothetical protein [Nesterenkonia alkaliphila]GFZ85484.1 hypothetical protein GCM10011359_13270 [Nesterenkonia alkaliphila]